MSVLPILALIQLVLPWIIHEKNYGDVTRAAWCLKSPAIRLFAQQLVEYNNTGNIKVQY